MRALITGAHGQVGTDLVLAAEKAGHDVVGLSSSQLDITDHRMVAEVVESVAPDVLINCAAFTAVDRCESEPELAAAVNHHAVASLGEACDAQRVHLVHISTDYVFPGTKAEPYIEGDEPDPINAYGRTKLAGERSLDPRHTVVRTSWVCGRHGSNVVKFVLNQLQRGEPPRFVTDQRGCPTFAADLGPMLVRLAEARVSGLFHVTNQGPVTWYEFAREIVAAAGHDPDVVERLTSADLHPSRAAQRPANSVLESVTLRSAGFDQLGPHDEALARLVTDLQSG